MIYRNNLDAVGNTPLIKITEDELDKMNVYIKYEGVNPTGSVKDRAANYVLEKLLNNKEINRDTMIIESSSGNFGIALASYCKKFNLKSTIVIDPNVLKINEFLIRSLAANVVKVDKRDETGGYLRTRIRCVTDALKENNNMYWMNQYENPYIAEAYCNTLGQEICYALKVDYIFIGVSSGGTITGVSQSVKRYYPDAKVIAVDSVGSVIFENTPQIRYIPGIGSSMRPEILKHALIDDVILVEERAAINSCYEFLYKHSMLIGGSSGSVFHAIKQYFEGKKFETKPNVVALFADRGDRYINTIYTEDWVNEHYNQREVRKEF